MDINVLEFESQEKNNAQLDYDVAMGYIKHRLYTGVDMMVIHNFMNTGRTLKMFKDTQMVMLDDYMTADYKFFKFFLNINNEVQQCLQQKQKGKLTLWKRTKETLLKFLQMIQTELSR